MHEELTYEEYEKTIIEYEQKYNLQFPRRNTYTYFYIEEIADYEYTNTIAYEMVRRNEEFKELTKKPYTPKIKDWTLNMGMFKIQRDRRVYEYLQSRKITFNIRLSYTR